MTKREGAIISAYTGHLCCVFSVFHEYAESLLGRYIFTHEFGDRAMVDKIAELSKDDFMELMNCLEED